MLCAGAEYWTQCQYSSMGRFWYCCNNISMNNVIANIEFLVLLLNLVLFSSFVFVWFSHVKMGNLFLNIHLAVFPKTWDLTSISFHLHVSVTAVDFSAISLHPKFANSKLVNCQWFMSKWTHISIRTFWVVVEVTILVELAHFWFTLIFLVLTVYDVWH